VSREWWSLSYSNTSSCSDRILQIFDVSLDTYGSFSITAFLSLSVLTFSIVFNLVADSGTLIFSSSLDKSELFSPEKILCLRSLYLLMKSSRSLMIFRIFSMLELIRLIYIVIMKIGDSLLFPVSISLTVCYSKIRPSSTKFSNSLTTLK
jgi:hypothetical protein